MSDFNNRIMDSPLDYVEASVLARETGQALLQRLDWMNLKPKYVLDLGCGTGEQTALLQARYQAAKIIALDHSSAMLEHASASNIPQVSYVCADAYHLPFANQALDLIFAHFFLPWQTDFKKIFREWRRVLSANGLLIFSAFGPDTGKTWQADLDFLPQLIDMHDLGDALLAAGFADPVLDVDYYTVNYRDKHRFVAEMSAAQFIPMHATLPEALFPMTYEIIYAHAFMPLHQSIQEEDGSVKIPISALRRK